MMLFLKKIFEPQKKKIQPKKNIRTTKKDTHHCSLHLVTAAYGMALPMVQIGHRRNAMLIGHPSLRQTITYRSTTHLALFIRQHGLRAYHIILVQNELPLVMNGNRSNIRHLYVLEHLGVVQNAAEIDLGHLQVNVGKEDLARQVYLVVVLVLGVANGQDPVDRLVVRVLLEQR